MDASKEVGLEVNVEKTKCKLVPRGRNAGLRWDMKIAEKTFRNLSQFQYLVTTVPYQNLI
jgi:hypothetical protein